MNRNPSRKIQVLTGTRADYGLLRWLMVDLVRRDHVVFETVVTGTHFESEFGNTWQAIESDGLPISHRVDIYNADDTPAGVARSTGVAITGMADVFESSKPDLLVVLGDRFEALAAAEAAFLMGIPVAHIAGGEITEGALDDSIRHAITKLSSLHFVASEEYAQRVIQLGEDPAAVFNVGAIGLDNFASIERMTAEDLSQFVGLDVKDQPFILCTLHAETTSDMTPENFFAPLAEALDSFPHHKVILTRSNSDAGGRRLNQLFDEYASTRSNRVRVIASLGQRAYISALEASVMVLGNSSSGIVEAPTAGTPTVNIGTRQKGRMRAPSIIDVANVASELRAGMERALSPEFQGISAKKISPFGASGASTKIADVITSVELGSLSPKRFHDLSQGENNDHR